MGNKFLTVMMVAFLGIGMVACDVNQVTQQTKTGETQRQEANFTETQQKTLIRAVPPPKLSDSLERRNLAERLVRFNESSKVSYIYLLSDYGTVITFYSIKGKVSSVNSKLTTGEQMVKAPFTDTYNGAGGNLTEVVESPQLDGSYGTNGDGIFFFTTEDVYVEWNGKYMLCDEPLRLTTKPVLMQNVDE